MTVDSEFKNLIPPLSPEERQGLESSLLKEGCRDALVLWGDILIDGHNRYEICTKHNIPYKTVQREFERTAKPSGIRTSEAGAEIEAGYCREGEGEGN